MSDIYKMNLAHFVHCNLKVIQIFVSKVCRNVSTCYMLTITSKRLNANFLFRVSTVKLNKE